MKSIKSILTVWAVAVAASAGAQTLKMEPQRVGVTTYEASTAVNLVVVKPEVKLDVLDPAVFTVTTNGTERNVVSVYPSDSRGAGSVSPQGFDNIYEWMNAQVLTAPEITNPRW